MSKVILIEPNFLISLYSCVKIASLAVHIFQLWKCESGLETGTIQTESQESSYGW